MDGSELLQKYAQGHRRFVLVNLRGSKLSGANLAGANFNRANLTEANLVRAKLGDTSLVRANLTRADLRGADLSGANLRNANLTGAEVDLTSLPPTAYAGAILPDGSRQPLTPLTESAEADPSADPLESNAASLAAKTAVAGSIPTHALMSATPQEPIRGEGETATGRPGQPPRLAADDPVAAAAVMTNFPDLTAAAQPPWRWRQLPWLQLSFWSMGYGFLGLFLYLYTAPIWAWPLVWGSSLLWLGHPSWLWFVPVAAAVAVVVGSGLSSGAMLVGGLVSLGLAAGLQATGWAWQRALRGGLWIGGVGCLLVAIAPLMLARSQSAGLGIPSTLPLGLMMAIGIALVALGTRALPRIQRLRPQPRDAAWILGVGAGLGLLISCLIGWLAIASLA